jgi:hypothetical protein
MRVSAAMVAAARVSGPPEGVRAVTRQFHLVSDLLEGGLDAVAPLGDYLLQDRWHAALLVLVGGTSTAVPRAAWERANAAPLRPLSVSRSGGGGPANSRSVVIRVED